MLVERVAYAATEARAARELLGSRAEAARRRPRQRRLETPGVAGVALLVRNLRERLDGVDDDLGLGDAALRGGLPAELRALPAPHRQRGRACARSDATSPPRAAAIGCRSTSSRSRCAMRCASSPSARSRRRPSASTAATSWCRRSFIRRWPSSATSGSRCPRRTAAPSSGNLAMILTTEELSRASLAAAGSLITRPEILTKALLSGGTEDAEARLAAAHRVRRDHGRHLGDGARHRQRRRRREVPRRAPQRGRATSG